MTASLPILYSFRRCPYAMRARLALCSARIVHEHREVDLKNKPPEMLAISPKGTVPVLQLGDGTVLEQSLDIMKWALHAPQLPLEDEQMITENDGNFKQALDRYKYPDRYLAEVGSAYREQCTLFLRKIEDRLNPFLTGNAEALIDMALFPFVRQFAMVDPEWFEAQPYPSLKAWLDFFNSSAFFQKAMQNYPLWPFGDQRGTQPAVIVF